MAEDLRGAQAVEDYVTSILLDLVSSGPIMASDGSRPLTRDELEQQVIGLWFNSMKTVRKPGAGMPRVMDFQTLWDQHFPANSIMDDLITAYGMSPSK